MCWVFIPQINVVHINATAKNAADDKIRQSLRRFSDSHPPGTKVVLISSKWYKCLVEKIHFEVNKARDRDDVHEITAL